MGQYWLPVNLDKREYINPHELGTGLKLLEQVWNSPGTPAALLLLTAAMPEPRGGGDPEAHPAIGRWAGDRVAVVGDYAEDSDLPDSEIPASVIYTLCKSKSELNDSVEYWKEQLKTIDTNYRDRLEKKIAAVKKHKPFKNISKIVAAAIEKIFEGKFQGTGWRKFVQKNGANV